MPREESFPIPLRYIDATRATSTTLDVMLERRIDDYLITERNRDLSDSLTGFTRFTIMDEKTPDGYTWSWERLTKKQTTSRPDYLWPENMERHVRSNEQKNKIGLSENRSLTMLESCKVFTSLSKKCAEKVG